MSVENSSKNKHLVRAQYIRGRSSEEVREKTESQPHVVEINKLLYDLGIF